MIKKIAFIGGYISAFCLCLALLFFSQSLLGAKKTKLKAEAIEKAMVEMELKLNAIDSEELEDLADVYAKEARKMEVEALRMAEEATKIAEVATAKAEKFELFMDEFQPILIKDGYLKKGKEIDELRFKDGKVWVNDKEVKASDAKRYYKIRNKYFDSDDSFYIN